MGGIKVIRKNLIVSIIVCLILGTMGLIRSNAQVEETKYVTTANLNVRSGPGVNYKKVGMIPKGQTVQVNASVNSEWVSISYQQNTRYVYKAYLKKISTNDKVVGTKYVTTANLNVRSGPGINYKKVGMLSKGQTVQVVTSVNSKWVSISYEQKTCYVSKGYLKNTKKERWEEEAIPVTKQPNDVTVIVNKAQRLPDFFVPAGLVTCPVPFITNYIEVQQLRSDASQALVHLFAAAKKAGVPLVGVSGYRSYETQVALFNNYVKRDGYEKARTYSAIPGTSEHQTGLAIDVTSANGKCPAQDCFGQTKEAKWLAAHAADYGFIIRYPKGKESITGYKYEPWHLRYVGRTVAKAISQNNLTLEEYLGTKAVSN